MFTITHHQTTTSAASFVRRYRAVRRIQALCAQCPQYRQTWACPPYPHGVRQVSDGFATVILMADVLTLDPQLVSSTTGEQQCRDVTQQVLDQAWKQLLPRLYDMERQHPGSRCFAGRCRLCPEGCTRPAGKPCRHPQLMRHSLESAGFNVSAAASDLLGIDLQWSPPDRLPHHITLVTAIFLPTTL